ncbi:MAG: hypothetical protein AAGF45_02600 [Pseudomonadota bacterium]
MKRLDAGQPVACSLNDEEFRKRRAFIRQTILPFIIRSEPMAEGVILHFRPSASLRSKLEDLVHLERQCCGFLDFLVLPEDAHGHADRLMVSGPAEAKATLEMFAKLAEESAP